MYRAHHVHTEQLVALKILRSDLASDPQMLERLFLEARAAAKIDDPRIVRVSDCGLASTGQAFIAMELLEGRDLRHVLDQGPRLTPPEVVDILLEVLEGLQAAHANGVVHRDLKPANVFLARQRGRDQVKLLDFGISKMRVDDSQSGLTRTNTAMGTPAYMAPEQMQNARGVDARADLYSVAAMAYELLCGEPPFAGAGYEEVVLKMFTQTAPPLNQRDADLPVALCLAVDRGLSKDPAARWQSAREFADALRPSPGGKPAPRILRKPRAPTSPLPATVPVVATPVTPATQVVAPKAAAPAGQSKLALGVTLGALAALGGAGLGAWAMRPSAQVTPVVAPARPTLASPSPPELPTAAKPVAKADTEPNADTEPATEPEATRSPVVPTGPVQLHEPSIVGEMDYQAVVSLLESSRAQLDKCRTARTVTVYVHLHTHGEGVGLARDDPNQKNEDLEAARCVANRLKAAASKGWKSGGSGIIAVSVTLAAR